MSGDQRRAMITSWPGQLASNNRPQSVKLSRTGHFVRLLPGPWIPRGEGKPTLRRARARSIECIGHGRLSSESQANVPDRRSSFLRTVRGIYMIGRIDLPATAARVKTAGSPRGGVTASTEVIAVKRHTGVHASVTVCKNTIANQNLAYAA